MKKNAIFIGDNLKVMTSPDFEKYKDYFKMIYIDPPYNTKTQKSYNDNRTVQNGVNSFLQD